MLYPPMLVNLLPTTKTRINARLYQERPCAVDLLTAFDTDTLIDESDRNNSFIIFSPPPKTSTYRPYQLRKRQHPYLLPTVQYSQF